MTSHFETLVWVFFLGHLSLDGEVANFLKLQHLSPVLFDHILAHVQAVLTGALDQIEKCRIESAKKASAPAHSGAIDLSSHETSGTNIRDNLKENPGTSR